MLRHAWLVSMLTALIWCAATTAFAVTYTGSLQYTPPTPPDVGDGLFVGPSDLQWANYTVGISWSVTDADTSYPGYPWKYTYSFDHNGGQAAISHIIIEGSQGISLSDIAGLTGGTASSAGLQRVTSGAPNMPEDTIGIRFHPPAEGQFSMTWSFWSNRAPTWGDFYARCGGKLGGFNYSYNYNVGTGTGSTDPDSNDSTLDDIDPTSPAANGSVDFHILRPDSVVPEPSSLLALLSGLGAIGMLIRYRR